MPGARGPHLLAVDDVALAAANGGGLQARRLGAGVGLGHAEGLQAQFATGNPWQIALLLFGRPVAQDGAHDVHLGVRRCCVAAVAVDLFEDDRRLGNAEPSTTVLAGDEHRQPARLGQRSHEFGRVAAAPIELAPVCIRIGRAQLADGGANGAVLLRSAEVHRSARR